MPNTPTLPRVAIQSIGGGLLLMSLFTMMWAGIASGGLTGVNRMLILVIFSLFSVAFTIFGLYLFAIAGRFAKTMSNADKAEGKNMGIWFGIIFGLEGITIPIVAFVCLRLNYGNLVLPAIALVVGLHFYPMAKVFKRKIDYYLATWTCLIAITSIIMILEKTVLPFSVYTYLGVGVAVATTLYGLYMINEGYGLTRKLK